jgi:hypothetical protein
VTLELLLHGSANMIGGQAVVIQNKFELSREEIKFPNAPRSIKFASGENMALATSCLRHALGTLR